MAVEEDASRRVHVHLHHVGVCDVDLGERGESLLDALRLRAFAPQLLLEDRVTAAYACDTSPAMA